MNLTPHFTREELEFSQTAVRKGINNSVPEHLEENLAALAAVLEQVRSVLNGKPMRITSGYRSPKLNGVIPGSSKTSAHTKALAADFVCPDFGTPLEICRALAASNIVFDQIIEEGTWVHVAVAASGEKPRREILTAHFSHGKVRYSKGLA